MGRAFAISVALALALPGCSDQEERNRLTDSAPPKLVVLIVVDQLRGDFNRLYPDALRDDGGLSRMVTSGTVYTQAYYAHATTRTAPGHATIATGADPRFHGIIANDWFDFGVGRRMTAVEDPNEALIASGSDAPAASPRNMLAPTFADELIVSTGAKGKVVGVSAKDRGAVLLAGHLGEAYWFSTADGRFITSTYYHQEALPDWVRAFNDSLSDRWPDEWALLDGPYSHRNPDDRPYEIVSWGLGSTFPHKLPTDRSKDYFEALKRTPFMDEITLDLAIEAINSEGMGIDEFPDVLAVGLSATDYVGHAFGIYSLEAEENLRRLNRSLARFMSRVESVVGADNVLYVLTADHGGDGIPAYRSSLGGEGYVLIAPRLLEQLNQELAEQFNVEGPLIAGFHVPSLTLNQSLIDAAGLDFNVVLDSVVERLDSMPGVYKAVTDPETQLQGSLRQFVKRSIHPERSGHIYLVQAPATFLGWSGYVATHGSPYVYDRHVALVFFRPGQTPSVLSQAVDIKSISPTISHCLFAPIAAMVDTPRLPDVCD